MATGTEINNMPQVEMRLEVAIPGGEPYIITHKQCFSPLSVGMLQRGGRMPILMHPRRKTKSMLLDQAG